MKDTIERLQILADRANKYKYPKDSNMGVRISDIEAVLEFYEASKTETEPLLTITDITPEWDKIDEKYKWIAIDEGGDEFAFVRRPTKLYNHINRFNEWTARDAVFTGRYFDMSVIDWTKTLSKRPVK